MRDLLVITPSRGRPQYAARLLQRWAATAMVRTDLIFGLDTDDPELPAYEKLFASIPGLDARVFWETGPRQQLGPWTNDLARKFGSQYRAVASFGDDHVPRTQGWDARLLEAVEATGGGFAWPEGFARPGFPEAVAVGSRVVEALGWFCQPGLQHWYVDQVWWDLAVGARCGTYLGDVTVAHEHVPADQTGAESWELLAADRRAYARWLAGPYEEDVAAVKGALTR